MSYNLQEVASQRSQQADRLRRKLKTAQDLYERSGSCWAKQTQSGSIARLKRQIAALEGPNLSAPVAVVSVASDEQVELETNKTPWPLPG